MRDLSIVKVVEIKGGLFVIFSLLFFIWHVVAEVKGIDNIWLLIIPNTI